MQTIYIFERGVAGWQSILGDWRQWPNQAAAWINNRTPHKAQALPYFCPATLAALTRPRRARNFAKLIEQYAGWRIILVCHSEGTATALAALRLARWPRIDELHLICGACDSDFQANGLNGAVASGRVGHVFAYVAKKDFAMELENTYAGSLCFGLQTAGQPLGLSGPTNELRAFQQCMDVIIWPEYGHSTCWLPNHFEATMNQIIHSPDLPVPAAPFEKALSFLKR